MGASLDFVPANNDRVDLGDITTLDGATALTFSFWVKFDSLTAGARISSKWGSLTANQSFIIQLDNSASDELRYAMNTGAGLLLVRDSLNANLSTGIWYNVIVTWSQFQNVSIYLDNTSLSLASVVSNNITSFPNSSSNFEIGTESGTSTACIDGKISQYAVWKRVLSAAERAELASGLIPCMIPNPDIYIPLWDSSTQYDLSGNGNNGTLAATSGGGPDESEDGPPIFIPSFQGLNFPSPAAGGGTVHNLTLTESITLSDDIPKQISRGLSETINLSDSIQKTIARSLVESLSLSDSIIREITRKLTETLVLSDTEKKEVTRKLTETISLSDSVLANLIILLNLTETISLTDSITKETVRTLNEAISLSDLSSKSITRRLSEVVSISDSLSAAIASLIDYIEMTSTSVTVPAMTGQAVAIADFYSESISNPDFVSESLL